MTTLPADRDRMIAELYAAHWERLVRLAWLLLRDQSAAEDVVQDAYVATHRNWASIRESGRVVGYLQTAVVNGCRSLHRHTVVVDRHHAREVAAAEALGRAGHESAESQVLRAAERSSMVEVLATLPGRQREVLVLRYYCDLSEAQIAHVLDISRGSVKAHVHRGLSALRGRAATRPSGRARPGGRRHSESPTGVHLLDTPPGAVMNRDHLHGLDAPDGRGGHDATGRDGVQVEARVEAQLRTALDLEARSIQPEDRLDVILAATRAAVPLTSKGARPSAHRRLTAVGAAAAAALVVATVWAVNRPVDGPVTPGPASRSAAPAPTRGGASETSNPPSTTSPPTSSGSPSTSSDSVTGPAPARSEAAALPVFRVGVVDGTGGTLGLVREPVPAGIEAATTPSQRALAAATLSVEDSAATVDAGYRPLWAGTRVTNVDVGPDVIRVTLTHGARGLSATQATLAVQQLVWTVQSAVAPSNRQPVRFTLADGSTALAGDLTTTSSYTRPTDPATLNVILAPLWIDQPYPRQVLSVGAPMTVTGQASTVDARVEWTLTRGGSLLASGNATATVAAPARGSFSFSTAPLDRGDYSITVQARSPRDGSVTAQWQIPFSVR